MEPNHVLEVMVGSSRGVNVDAIRSWIESRDCTRLCVEEICRAINKRMGAGENEPLLQHLLQTMEDLSRQHPDEIFWVGSCETLFERLYGLYSDFGGDLDALHEKFPEMA